MSASGALLLIVSPFVGSFIGCVADRVPTGRSVLSGRSVCDHCRHVLGAVDLVPVASWLIQRARCRHCGGRISSYYPLVEAAAFLVTGLSLALAAQPLNWIAMFLGWGLLALAAMDLRYMVLGNSLNVALLVSGLIVASVWSTLPMRDHLLGTLIGVVVFYCINLAYRMKRGQDGLGMGDVLLMGCAGAWVGWQGLPSVLIYATGAALPLALISGFTRPLRKDTAIPFGAFLCFGIWLTWVAGPIEVGGLYAGQG